MVHRKEYFEGIVSQIKGNFPRVRNAQIDVVLKKIKRYHFIGYKENDGYVIEVDTETIPHVGSKRAIVGCLAHELAHFQIDEGLTGLAHRQDTERYNSSEVYRRKEEKLADLEAILRGFGREIYSMRLLVEKNHWKNSSNYGLTLKEIRKLVYSNS